MARIESAGSGDKDVERESLKKEIMSEMRGDARRRKAIGCGSCALVWLIVLLVGFWFVGSTLTKTGFFDVPLIPASVYVTPEPVRVVTPLAGTDPEDVPAIVGAGAKFNTSSGKLSLPMKETDLTTVVNHAFVSGIEGLPFEVRQAQVAIEPDHIELFLRSPQDDRMATIRVRFTPSVEAGKVSLVLRDIEVGMVPLPKFMAEMAFGAIRTAFEDAIANATASVGSLSGIELERGKFTLMFTAPKQ